MIDVDEETENVFDAAAATETLTLAEAYAKDGPEPVGSMDVDEESRPKFPVAKDADGVVHRETRKVPVPPHRMTPLKATWSKIYTPLIRDLKLQVRMNIRSKAVELRTSPSTTETGALQRGEDFVRAYTMGFDIEDAIAILRLDGVSFSLLKKKERKKSCLADQQIFIQSFEIKDVKTLEGDHLSRAVGRIVGKDGRTKHVIENTTKTRIVVAGGSKIHIMGGFKQIGIARETIVSLMYVFCLSPKWQGTRLTKTVWANRRARCTTTCASSASGSRSASEEERLSGGGRGGRFVYAR